MSLGRQLAVIAGIEEPALITAYPLAAVENRPETGCFGHSVNASRNLEPRA
jgi:hypothetical protein